MPASDKAVFRGWLLRRLFILRFAQKRYGSRRVRRNKSMK